MVDTTGAGDAFHGALAAGVAQGMAWLDLLRFASVAGALCCTKHGAADRHPHPGGGAGAAAWRELKIAPECAIMAAFKEISMSIAETIALCKEILTEHYGVQLRAAALRLHRTRAGNAGK